MLLNTKIFTHMIQQYFRSGHIYFLVNFREVMIALIFKRIIFIYSHSPGSLEQISYSLVFLNRYVCIQMILEQLKCFSFYVNNSKIRVSKFSQISCKVTIHYFVFCGLMHLLRLTIKIGRLIFLPYVSQIDSMCAGEKMVLAYIV